MPCTVFFEEDEWKALTELTSPKIPCHPIDHQNLVKLLKWLPALEGSWDERAIANLGPKAFGSVCSGSMTSPLCRR